MFRYWKWNVYTRTSQQSGMFIYLYSMPPSFFFRCCCALYVHHFMYLFYLVVFTAALYMLLMVSYFISVCLSLVFSLVDCW